MFFPVGSHDCILSERGIRLGKSLEIVEQSIRADSGIFIDGIMSCRPCRCGFYARIVFPYPCINHAFEPGIGPASIGTECLRKSRLHVMRRILVQPVNEAAVVRVVPVGDNPCLFVCFRQMLNLAQETAELLPCKIGFLRISGRLRFRLTIQMIRQIKRLGNPLCIGEIDMRRAARIGTVAETTVIPRFGIAVLQAQKPFAGIAHDGFILLAVHRCQRSQHDCRRISRILPATPRKPDRTVLLDMLQQIGAPLFHGILMSAVQRHADQSRDCGMPSP